jgi:hypothetical protein
LLLRGARKGWFSRVVVGQLIVQNCVQGRLVDPDAAVADFI